MGEGGSPRISSGAFPDGGQVGGDSLLSGASRVALEASEFGMLDAPQRLISTDSLEAPLMTIPESADHTPEHSETEGEGGVAHIRWAPQRVISETAELDAPQDVDDFTFPSADGTFDGGEPDSIISPSVSPFAPPSSASPQPVAEEKQQHYSAAVSEPAEGSFTTAAIPASMALPQAGIYKSASNESLGVYKTRSEDLARAHSGEGLFPGGSSELLRGSSGSYVMSAAGQQGRQQSDSFGGAYAAPGELPPYRSYSAGGGSPYAAARQQEADWGAAEKGVHEPQSPQASGIGFAPGTPDFGAAEASHVPATAATTPHSPTAAAAAELQGNSEYFPRETHTPYMQRKVRDLQKQDWQGATGDISEDAKPIPSKAQRGRDEAAAAWKERESAAGSAASASQPEPAANGVLGQDFKVHKSRLEQEVEAAASREHTPPPVNSRLPSYMRPTAASVIRTSSPAADRPARSPSPGNAPPGSLENVLGRRHVSALEAAKLEAQRSGANKRFEPVRKTKPPTVPGLDALLSDTGRIQRAREEAAKRHSDLYKPVPKKAQQPVPGLDEVLIVTKSQLEIEKEVAAAGGRPPTPPRPPTPSRAEDPAAVQAAERLRQQREAQAQAHVARFAPAPKRQEEPDAFGGKGIDEVCIRHKSTLQRNKEASEAAGANSPHARVRTPSRSDSLAKKQSESWGNKGLQELQKPHRSRLEVEKEAWCKAEGKEYKPRKVVVHDKPVQSPGNGPGAPSYMRDTSSSVMKHINIPEPPRTPTTPVN